MTSCARRRPSVSPRGRAGVATFVMRFADELVERKRKRGADVVELPEGRAGS